ncbi:serine/threonine-protein phosphatase 6 regulatory ankyrin repeat subunit B-like [Chrysoperla carnea]|uniref:serine/threonine-protein phosphatase 6 regulatory ankyrin repeat subunit B-like n=1 Tax=Chrysoperla carnea TaxID=189513 RepID=UPI001D05EF0A|nr:serine/threonine-protein phosphatase 6 regulatory ankyrin repeat subunit B-like [Chrysoperla carnea]
MDRRNNRGRRRRLIPAIRHGKLETARELINSYELPCSESSPKGYDLLCDALDNKHSEVAKLLLTSGTAVNSKENNYQRTSETPLHFTVMNGDIEIMKMLLVRRANINAQNIYGQTPLHKAIEKNDRVEIIELFLKHEADVNVKDHKADVNVKDEDRNTPLFYAIQNPNLKITKLLLDNGANVKDDPELLNIAVKRGCTEIVELLLQHNADVNATDENGYTALLSTLSDFYQDFCKLRPDRDSYVNNIKRKITKLLLNHGANVDAQTRGGWTALHFAVYNGYSQVVEVLLEYNANVNFREKKKSRDTTPYVCTKKKCSNDIVKLLLERGAEVDSKTKYNITPLYLSAQRGQQEIIETLLKFGADINCRNMGGNRALHIASQFGHVKVVTTLLEYGCDINSRDIDGRTALHIASHLGHNEVVTTLLEYGCDINSRDKVGNIALHIASHQGHNEIVTTLLEYGSDINIMTYNNLTPLDYAKTAEKAKTIEILKRHIVQMKTANLYVSQQNLRSVDEISFPDFQEKCENEITSMKSEKMNNYNISFYDILTKNTDSLAICLRNENIVQILKLDDYKTKFPIYGSMIKSRFRNGMKRKELIDQGNKILHFLFANHLQLPQECTEKICSYLSNEDLKIIIEKSISRRKLGSNRKSKCKN